MLLEDHGKHGSIRSREALPSDPGEFLRFEDLVGFHRLIGHEMGERQSSPDTEDAPVFLRQFLHDRDEVLDGNVASAEDHREIDGIVEEHGIASFGAKKTVRDGEKIVGAVVLDEIRQKPLDLPGGREEAAGVATGRNEGIGGHAQLPCGPGKTGDIEELIPGLVSFRFDEATLPRTRFVGLAAERSRYAGFQEEDSGPVRDIGRILQQREGVLETPEVDQGAYPCFVGEVRSIGLHLGNRVQDRLGFPETHEPPAEGVELVLQQGPGGLADEGGAHRGIPGQPEGVVQGGFDFHRGRKRGEVLLHRCRKRSGKPVRFKVGKPGDQSLLVVRIEIEGEELVAEPHRSLVLPAAEECLDQKQGGAGFPGHLDLAEEIDNRRVVSRTEEVADIFEMHLGSLPLLFGQLLPERPEGGGVANIVDRTESEGLVRECGFFIAEQRVTDQEKPAVADFAGRPREDPDGIDPVGLQLERGDRATQGDRVGSLLERLFRLRQMPVCIPFIPVLADRGTLPIDHRGRDDDDEHRDEEPKKQRMNVGKTRLTPPGR